MGLTKRRDSVKKSHTCEEGGTHLRISFWHLLMFEKPENQNVKKMKKTSGVVISLTCAIKNTIKWCCLLRYGVQQTYWPQILKSGKNVKYTWRYYPFTHVHHKSRPYDDSRFFSHFGSFFALLPLHLP